MDMLFQDLRYAARKLLRTPAFTAVAVLTLALGIGATTAVYSVVDAVVIRPLGFANPGQLVRVGSIDRNGTVDNASPLDLRDYGDESRTLAGLVPMKEPGSVSLQRDGAAAVRLVWTRVGARFFSLLGVNAEMGRVFAPGEDAPGSPKIVILSDATWRNYFDADPKILGRQIRLDDEAYTVVGVAAPAMKFPGTPNFWVPYVYQKWEVAADSRGVHEIYALGRLKPGVTVDAARADLQAIARRLAQQYPETNTGYGASVESLKDEMIDPARAPLLAMMGAVALVLLIACANVANLLLVRAASRQTEIAVRTALGAARARVIRQLMVESVLLSLAGFFLGALFATWAVDAVVAFGPSALPRLSEIAVNARVLLLAAGVALATGVLFGLAPALHAARPNTSAMLREGGRGVSRSGMARTRSVLIVSELALAVVLLVGAGLLLRGFARLVGVDPGFDRARVIAFDVELNDVRYPHDRETNAFANALSERLRNMPGTQAIGIADANPFETQRTFEITTSFNVDGRPKNPLGHDTETELMPVTAGYFRALGVPLMRGRLFSAAEDLNDTPPVVIVNQAFVRRYFPGEEAIGKRIVLGIAHGTGDPSNPDETAQGEIIGIVGDVREQSLADTVSPRTYVPFNAGPFHVAALLRTTADPDAVAQAIRASIRELDPDVPVYDLHTLDDALSASVAQPRFYAILLGTFATIALILAALGIYGVISYTVSQRTTELGIRIALGAAPERVLRLVLGDGMGLTAAGLAIGVLGAVGLTRTISTLLFGVPPLDPLTYVATILGLAAVAALACWIPARRAARVDPVIAMRTE
jgi:putative ABC transport system permease protein